MSLRENINTWIAWHLPRTIAYWCAVRVFTAITAMPEHSHRETSTFTAIEALQAWGVER